MRYVFSVDDPSAGYHADPGVRYTPNQRSDHAKPGFLSGGPYGICRYYGDVD